MRQSFLAIALCGISVSALAHDDHQNHHRESECNYDVNFGVKLGKQQVVFDRENTPVYVFENGRVTRNGNVIELSAQEQQLARQYEQHTREFVPQLVKVTKEGLKIGAEATVGAFSLLLGKEHEDLSQIQSKFDQLALELENRMSEEMLPPRPLSVQKEDYNFMGDGAALGWAVASAGFSVLGQAIRAEFDPEYKKAWEARMKNFEQEFESRIESKAETLAKEAQGMCRTLEKMDAIETQLAASNNDLSDLNVVGKRN